jgi:hypothetical protein
MNAPGPLLDIRFQRLQSSEVPTLDSASLSNDAIVRSKVSSVPGMDHVRQLRYARLIAHRRLLRDGCEDHLVKPFEFYKAGERCLVAENSGLEGFVFSQRRFEARYGNEASVAHFDHYVAYLCRVLEGEALGQSLLEEVYRIAGMSASVERRHDELLLAVRLQTDEWRREVDNLDSALWGKHARLYQVFHRALNPSGFEEAYDITRRRSPTGRLFTDLDTPHFEALRKHSFSGIRFLDTYEIGQTNAKGSAGGSPYSIRSHQVDPAHGTTAEVRATLEKAYQTGMLSIFEVVPNHTSCDAELLQHDPRMYVHTREEPSDPTGYFYFRHPEMGDFWIRYGGYKNLGSGKREFWIDTLQLDLSNPETRDYCISQVLDLVRRTRLDGIRIDSAYQMLNKYFETNWSGELTRDLPQREFLEELITRVKIEFPQVVVAAEAFTDFDKLAECGVDLIYGLTSMERHGGHLHQGWHEALLSGKAETILKALEREEFLVWQVGGPSTICFWQHIDRVAIEHEFEERLKYSAAVLTLLKPGALSFYNGAEVCIDIRCPEDGKVSSFNIPWQIDWTRRELPFARFVRSLLRVAADIREELGERTQLETLYPSRTQGSDDWVGYTIRSSDPLIKGGVRVLVNLSDSPTIAHFIDPISGLEQQVSLAPRGPQGWELVQVVVE